MLLVTLLWRSPSLFDPPWVNDEGTYFAISQAMAHGYRLYAGIWENKPPALYLLYSAVYHWFGASLIAIRLVAAAAVLLLVWTSWRLIEQLVDRQYAPVGALLVGILFGVPFLEGTTANAELFVALLAAVAVDFALVRRWVAAAGFLLGVAVLFKVVAIFDAAALGLWILFNGPRTEANAGLTPQIRTATLYACAVVLVPAVSGVTTWCSGTLSPMLSDAVLYNVGYVGRGNGGGLPWLLSIKVAILAALTAGLRRRSFPLLWLVFAAFGAVLSGRVFGHYLLQPIVPATLVLVGAVSRRSYSPNLLATVVLVAALAGSLLAAAGGWLLAAGGHDSILARRLQYYPNVVRLLVRQQPYSAYVREIDDHVTRNEAVARAIRRLPPGSLLVWGNTPWVYVLSDRLPATLYTSALRVPEVPGETAALRRALATKRPAVVVIIRPALPPLGAGSDALRRGYRLLRRIGTADLYVRAATR